MNVKEKSHFFLSNPLSKENPILGFMGFIPNNIQRIWLYRHLMIDSLIQ